MSFDDELVKLQRKRRAFLRFAADLNPGVTWAGNVDRRYGKVADNRGEVPIKGTVEAFGSFANFIANHEYTIEVPSTRVSLIDAGNEWRALADRPSYLLLHRRLAFHLRVHDDADTVFEQLITVGQIGSPSFPQGKVSFDVALPGGEYLGETVPRRLLSTTDWPRALPDDLGKPIPFVYGSLINAPPATTILITDDSGGSSGCTCELSEWGGSPTLLMSDDFEYTDVADFYTNWSPDIDNLQHGEFQSGATSLGNASGWYYRSIAAITAPLAEKVYLFGLQVKWDGDNAPGFGILFQFEQGAIFDGIFTHCALRLNGDGSLALTGPTGTVANSIFGVVATDQWNCITGMIEVTNPGSYRIYCNGSLVMSGAGANLGNDSYPVPAITIGVAFGYFVDDVWVARGSLADGTSYSYSCADDDGDTGGGTSTTVLCPESDGVSDQGSAGRGGWLTALLGDTGGGTTGLSDYPAPSGLTATLQAQPSAAPTIAGTLQTGGNGVEGVDVYYCCVTVHDGVLSEISNIVGPFTITSTDKRVELTFSGLAPGADLVRVYRSPLASFLQFDRYRDDTPTGDIDAGTTTIVDEWPGVDTRDQLDPDPRWDLYYRWQAYYQVSAIYEDVESACSAYVQVDLFPRNQPLSVLVSWSAPPSSSFTLTGYRVRRSGQEYHYSIDLDRQWDFDTSVTSFTDPNDDTSGALPCATEAQSGNKPVYIVAGHTCKLIREVFVLKPDPDSENKESIWVPMVEGVDYTTEVREINGNRYQCLVFEEQQRSDTCQYYPVTVNLDGVETNADGTGDLIVSAAEVIEHVFLNVIANTYRSSEGVYAPSGARYFTDVPYAPGLWSTASAQTAKAVSETRVNGGYLFAGAITSTISARQLLYDLITSGDFDLYQHQGVWHLALFDAEHEVRASLPAIDPDTGIIKDSFEPSVSSERHYNLMPWFAGPISGDGSKGYLLSGEVRSGVSIDLFGTLISEPTYLLWTQDLLTAYSVMTHFLKGCRYPPISARFASPIGLFTTPITTAVRISHPDGLGVGGWVDRVCRVYGVELDFDQLVAWVTVREVDDLVP